jgi:hypothetical protein
MGGSCVASRGERLKRVRKMMMVAAYEKKSPGLKPLVFARYFAGLKPYAPSEKAQQRVFSAAYKAALRTKYFRHG